jgi:hypothetical protein
VQLTGTQVDFNNSNNSAVINTVVLAGPGLTLSRNNNNLVITWPAAANNNNYVIQMTDTLSPANWVTLSSLPNGQLSISISPTNSSRFFRLQQP